MKTTKFKIAVGAIIALLLISIGAFISNSVNKRNFKKEKVQNESLVSQKLQISQGLDKVKGELTALKADYKIAEKAVDETNSKLTVQDRRIAFLSKENSSLMKDKSELTELQKSKSKLDKAYEDLKLKKDLSLTRIRDLEKSELVLDAEKMDLTSRLQNAETYRSDNFEIYGSRGNRQDRLTFVARRSKKLNLIFAIPQSLTDPLSFEIITPTGQIITPDSRSLTVVTEPVSNNLTASLSAFPGEYKDSRKVELTYTPKERLSPGVYDIQIFSKDKNIGNCRLKLR